MVLAAYIESRCTPFTEPREIRDETRRLRELLEEVKAERRKHNATVLRGLLLERYHPLAWVQEVIQDTDDPQLKDYLNQFVEKGEHYELQSQSTK